MESACAAVVTKWVVCLFFFSSLFVVVLVYLFVLEWSSTQLACMHSASSDESKDFSSNFVAIVAKGSANCEQLLALICTRACELLLFFFLFFLFFFSSPGNVHSLSPSCPNVVPTMKFLYSSLDIFVFPMFPHLQKERKNPLDISPLD